MRHQITSVGLKTLNTRERPPAAGVLNRLRALSLLGARGRLARGNGCLCSRADKAKGRKAVLGQLGVELTGLGRVRDKALIGALEIVALDLDGLVKRPDASQLLECRRILVEGFLA